MMIPCPGFAIHCIRNFADSRVPLFCGARVVVKCGEHLGDAGAASGLRGHPFSNAAVFPVGIDPSPGRVRHAAAEVETRAARWLGCTTASATTRTQRTLCTVDRRPFRRPVAAVAGNGARVRAAVLRLRCRGRAYKQCLVAPAKPGSNRKSEQFFSQNLAKTETAETATGSWARQIRKAQLNELHHCVSA